MEVPVKDVTLHSLKGRVVVLTGGAQGIGAATVTLLYEIGAHVVFGDWDEIKGKALEDKLRSSSKGGQWGGTVESRKVDVRDYGSQLALFEFARQTHKRVDNAICCAAVTEPAGWFEPENLDLESVKTPPTPLLNLIDVNLNGVISFTRIALAYMKEGAEPCTGQPCEFASPKSITLLSSVAGFKESPGLFAYSASKHGVIGLMRSLRKFTPAQYGVRVNVICPWATDTQLLSGVVDAWREEQLPLNQPEDVARIVLQVAAEETLHGRSVYIAGGLGTEIEDGIERLEPSWLGEQNSRDLEQGQKLLGFGGEWDNHAKVNGK